MPSTPVVIEAQVRRLAETGQLRRIREEARVSLSAVAAELGMPKSTLSRWERGQRKPSGPVAERWLTLMLQLSETP